LPELLVITAIIGVLIGLLVPAVQKVRETAGFVQGKNALRQIGIAVPNYASTHANRLPHNLNDWELPVISQSDPLGFTYLSATIEGTGRACGA